MRSPRKQSPVARRSSRSPLPTLEPLKVRAGLVKSSRSDFIHYTLYYTPDKLGLHCTCIGFNERGKCRHTQQLIARDASVRMTIEQAKYRASLR